MAEYGKRETSADPFGRLQPDRDQSLREAIALDPKIVKAGFDLTMYFVETGLKPFSDYARKMVELYGLEVRPYLKSWYLAVRYYPGIDPAGMDSAARVDDLTASWDAPFPS